MRKTHRNCPLNPRNAPNAPSTSKQACSRSRETDDEQQDSESDYGEGSDNDEPLVKRCTSCGGTGHARKSHKSCPKNPRNAPTEDPSSRSAEADEELSDFEGFEPDNGEVSSYEDLVSDMQGSSDEEEKVVEICDCGRAHKRDCPLNTRHRKAYSGKQKMQLRKGGIAPWVLLLVGRVKEKLMQLGAPKRESLPIPLDGKGYLRTPVLMPMVVLSAYV